MWPYTSKFSNLKISSKFRNVGQNSGDFFAIKRQTVSLSLSSLPQWYLVLTPSLFFSPSSSSFPILIRKAWSPLGDRPYMLLITAKSSRWTSTPPLLMRNSRILPSGSPLSSFSLTGACLFVWIERSVRLFFYYHHHHYLLLIRVNFENLWWLCESEFF